MKAFTIAQKAMIGMSVSLLMILSITGGYFGITLFKLINVEYETKGLAIAQSVSNTAIDAILNNDPASLQALIDTLLNIHGVSYVLIQDAEKDILCHTFSPVIPQEILTFLKEEQFHGGRDIVLGNQHYWNIQVPILNGQIGAVTLGIDKVTAKKEAIQNIIKAISLLLAISVLTLISMILLINKLTTPLRRITAYAVALSSHDFRQKLAIDVETSQLKDHPQPEVKTLAEAFFKLEEDLIKNLQNLESSLITQERLQSQLSIAAEIQSSLLPQETNARYDAATVTHYIHPAKEVGGDFVDHFVLHHRFLVTTVGDVSGKGVSAALIMATVLTMIRSTAQSVMSPAEILTIVNQEFCKHNKNDLFITVFLSVLDMHTGELKYANAGHNHPYRNQARNDWEAFGTELDLVLGIDQACYYKEHSVQLKPGESVVMYTDGITEAMNEQDQLFGDEALLETLSQYEGEDIVEHIKNTVLKFSGSAPQSDDQTLLELTYTGTPSIFSEPELSFYFENTLESISKLAQVVEQFGQANTLSKTVVMNLNLVLEELIANTIYYGYEDHELHYIYMTLSLNETQITITLSDDGKPFNPLNAPEVDAETVLEDRPIGGLGIHFVKALTQSLTYARDNDRNIITLTMEVQQDAN